MIGISMTDAFRHGANFNFEPGVLEYFRHLPKFENFVQLDRWYKVDISIDWDEHVYDVRLDDVPVVNDASFNTEHNSIARVGSQLPPNNRVVRRNLCKEMTYGF